jgi:hypothetical protein
VWFEPTLDDSFMASEASEGSPVTQWNDINPQNSSKYFMLNNSDEDGLMSDHIIYKSSEGPNGLPSLYFDDTFPIMDLSNSNYAANDCCTGLITGPVTAFIVYDVTDSDSYLDFWNYNGVNHWDYFVSEDGVFLRSFNAYSSRDYTHLGSVTASAAEIAAMSINASGFNVYINGTNKFTDTTAQDLTTGVNNTRFGIRYSGKIHVSEIIVFDRVLKDDERQSVEAYLGKKYAIRVTVDTP